MLGAHPLVLAGEVLLRLRPEHAELRRERRRERAPRDVDEDRRVVRRRRPRRERARHVGAEPGEMLALRAMRNQPFFVIAASCVSSPTLATRFGTRIVIPGTSLPL